MTAETEITNMLSHATFNAASLASSSASLVDAAVAALTVPVEFPLTPPYSPQSYGLENFDEVDFDQTEPPLTFPTWPLLNFGDVPDTRKLDEVSGDVDQIHLEELNLPAFNYPRIAALAGFSLVAPTVRTDFSLPETPNTEIDFHPDRLVLETLSTPRLFVRSPSLAPISTKIAFDPAAFNESFDQFKRDIFGGVSGLPGLDALLLELQGWTSRALEVLLPAALRVMLDRFTNQYSPVLAFHTQLQARLTERLNQEQLRLSTAITDRSGWDLPTAVQNALRATAEQVAQSWRQQALSQADTQTAELALQFFEFCGDLYEQLTRAVQSLKTKEIESVLEAHKMALAYAQQVIAALLTVFEAEVFTKQDVDFQKAQAQLEVFEAHLQVAMIQYEVAKAHLQVEQARQENDASQIKLYQTDVENASLDVNLYASQVAAARSELELKALPIDVFSINVRAFEARIRAHQSLVDARVAEIESDSARVVGELAKAKAFESEVRGFEKQIATKQAVLSAQVDRNAAVLAEFESKVKANLALTEQSLLLNQYELAKYEVIADNALSDAKLALAKAQSDLDFSTKEQAGLMTAYTATRERALALMNTELDRLRAIAEVNAQGAGIMAQMAEGAMSAANGIAGVIFKEEA